MILRPLLFNIYLSDLFISCNDSNIINYADDNSPFSCNDNIESVITQITIDSKSLLEWFANNGLKANPDKFHFIASNFDEENFVQVQQLKIYNTICVKLMLSYPLRNTLVLYVVKLPKSFTYYLE